MLSAHLPPASPPALTLEGLCSPRAQGFSSCTSWHPRSLLRLEFPREGWRESGGRLPLQEHGGVGREPPRERLLERLRPAPRPTVCWLCLLASDLAAARASLRPLHIRGDDSFCPVEPLAMPGKQLEHTLAQGRAPLLAEDHAAPHPCPPGGTDWPRLPTACPLPCGARAAVGEAGVRGCGRAAGCGGASPSRRAALGGRRLGALRPCPPLCRRFSRRGR